MKNPPNNQKSTQADIWAELAVKAQQGNKKAYHQLLSEILPYIQNYLIPRLANPDWAEEITQEVLISVHKSLHTYAADRPFRPWLMAIVNFRRTDFLRKHYRNRENKQVDLEIIDYQTEYVTNTDTAGELKDIETALNELPEKQREIFSMIKIQGYTAQEVAEKMGMSVSAVKVSAHRSQKKLQKKIG